MALGQLLLIHAAVLANAQISPPSTLAHGLPSTSRCSRSLHSHLGFNHEFCSSPETWISARRYCRLSLQGRLAVVFDAITQAWLETESQNQGLSDVWLGLNDRNTRGTFLWDRADNSEQHLTYRNWDTPVINSDRGRNCVYMDDASGWRWKLSDCNQTRSFICQYSVTNASRTAAAARQTQQAAGHSSSTHTTDILTTRRGVTTVDHQVTSLSCHEANNFGIRILNSSAAFPTGASTQVLSCGNRTAHDQRVLKGKPKRYSVGEQFIDTYCTSDQPLFTWRCCATSELSAEWFIIKNATCPRNKDLERLSQVNVTYETMISLLRDVINITSSNDIGRRFGLAVDDLVYTSHILNKVISLVTQKSLGIALSNVTRAFSAIVSRILDAPAEAIAANNTSASVSENMEIMLAVATDELQENMTLAYTEPNLVVQITSDPTIIGFEVWSGASGYSTRMNPLRANQTDGGHESDVVVFFANDAKESRKSFAVFENANLFQGTRMHPASKHVVSAQLSDTVVHPDLVTIVFKLPNVDNKIASYEDVICGFWSYARSDWSTFGCKKILVNPNRISCTCNHTANYALLFVNATYETMISLLRDVISITSSNDIDRRFGLAVDDLVYTSRILDKVISLVTQKSLGIYLNNVTRAFSAIVSRILDAPAEAIAASNTSASVSKNMEKMLFVASAELQENMTLAYTEPNLVVQITSDPTIIGFEVWSGALGYSTRMDPLRASQTDGGHESDVVVFFANNAKESRKSFAVFETAKLFQGTRMRPASKHVVCAQLSETVVHPDLVTIVFKLPNVVSKIASYEDIVCGFWSYDQNDWSTFGCKKILVNPNRISCTCNHTTNYAVLFSVYGRTIHKDGDRLGLSVVTRIGLSVSVILLLTVIVSFLTVRKLRSTAAHKVFFNISLSVCLLDAFFLIGIERTENKTACVAFAALIHVLVLSSFAWMSVEVTFFYLGLVKVFDAVPSSFLLKSAIPAWGLPVVFVSLCAVSDYRLYDTTELGVCWIQNGLLHYGVALPVTLSMAYNAVLFALIVRSLYSSSSRNIRSTMRQSDRLKMQARASFLVFVATGLTWILGYFAIQDAALTFHYLFSICNSLQGALMALLQWPLGKLLRREVRSIIKRAASKELIHGPPGSSSTLKTQVDRESYSTKL